MDDKRDVLKEAIRKLIIPIWDEIAGTAHIPTYESDIEKLGDLLADNLGLE